MLSCVLIELHHRNASRFRFSAWRPKICTVACYGYGLNPLRVRLYLSFFQIPLPSYGRISLAARMTTAQRQSKLEMKNKLLAEEAAEHSIMHSPDPREKSITI